MDVGFLKEKSWTFITFFFFWYPTFSYVSSKFLVFLHEKYFIHTQVHANKFVQEGFLKEIL